MPANNTKRDRPASVASYSHRPSPLASQHDVIPSVAMNPLLLIAPAASEVT